MGEPMDIDGSSYLSNAGKKRSFSLYSADVMAVDAPLEPSPKDVLLKSRMSAYRPTFKLSPARRPDQRLPPRPRHLSHNLRPQLEPHKPVARRVVISYDGICSLITSIFGFVRSLFTSPPIPITVEAVETSPDGNKRRAIQIGSEFTLTHIPGAFHTDAQPSMSVEAAQTYLSTPPSSRSGSADVPEPGPNSTGADALPQLRQQQEQPSLPPSPPRHASQTVNNARSLARRAPPHEDAKMAEPPRPPSSKQSEAPHPKWDWMPPPHIKVPKITRPREGNGTMRKDSAATDQSGPTVQKHGTIGTSLATSRSRLPLDARNFSSLGRSAHRLAAFPTRDSRGGQAGIAASESRRDQAVDEPRSAVKDREVNELIARAKQVAIESPQQRIVRERLQDKRRRIREEAEREHAEREAAFAKARAEAQAREEARIKAEREAKEAEEAKKKAEEEARRRKSLIRPLSEDWNAKIDEVMGDDSNMGKEVGASAAGTPLCRYDLGRVLPTSSKDKASGWLNDEAVNAWFDSLCLRKQQQAGIERPTQKTPPWVSYNTAWYTCVVDQRKGMDGIKSWSRRKGVKGTKLFDAEKIFFPVNTGAHWTLLIINPKSRTMEHLDSFGSSGKDEFKLGRQWLEMELGPKYSEGEWTELESRSNCQDNFSDCGVFACMNGLAAAKGVDYSDVRNMRLARRVMVAVFLNGGFTNDFEL